MSVPPNKPISDTFVELKRRSVAKALSWRVLATVVTTLVVVVMTGKWDLGAKVGIADTAFKFLLYLLHERAWARVNFGRRRFQG